MTQLLEQAIAQISRLSDQEQDAIAVMILEELEDEKEWDRQFETSQDKLAKLADRVRDDIRAGKTREIGFDEL